LQNVIYEMINFCEIMKPHKKIVIYRCYSTIYWQVYCIVFHSVSMFMLYFYRHNCNNRSVVTNQMFPTLVKYPFDVLSIVKTVIYIQQLCRDNNVRATMLNILMILLLWFTSQNLRYWVKSWRKLQISTRCSNVLKNIKN